MSKERRLGRGLAALLGNNDESPDSEAGGPATERPAKRRPTTAGRPSRPVPAPETGSASTPVDDASVAEQDDNDHGEFHEEYDDLDDETTSREMLVSINLIEANPFQPRREFGESEIVSLSESLKEHDLLQAVLLRRVGEKYQLISGERRLRAAIRAGWQKIPARVRDADDRLVAELAIVENLQRKDLNPIEKALSFQRYLQEHDCRQEDLAQRLKLNRSTIANLLRLLELPVRVQQSLQKGDITTGHARALLPLGDDREQVAFCKRINEEGWSVRETERLVSEAIGRDSPQELSVVGGSGSSGSKRTRNGQLASLQQELKRALGTKVEIATTARGKGKIVVHFKNHAEFERLRQLLMDGDGAESAVG